MFRYADILLPLAQPTYTFAVEEGMKLTEGMAVAVPFGRKNETFYAGIVWRLHNTPPQAQRVKAVRHPLYGGRVLLNETERRWWEWIADYYLSSLGEVMRIALPSLMKPASKEWQAFEEAEFRPRTERYLKSLLHNPLTPEELKLVERMERRAPKQYAAWLSVVTHHEQSHETWMPRRLCEAESEVLRTLERKGLLAICERERESEKSHEGFMLPQLSEAQQQTLASLREAFLRHETALLHGITGSGKTEIYIHLIAEHLSRGEDVLLLLPEIALTTQLVTRLTRIFSSRVTSYHSKLTPQRRTDTYLRLSRSEGGEFVVGTRSALFLPLKHLGLIIVDEEHDASYKQNDPAPRYQARDCAVAATRLRGCRTLLGSATPSLESWLNAQTGKYGLATLQERFGGSLLPEILCSDTLRAVKRGERKSHFNQLLLDHISQALNQKEQVLLFQNRRGFSPYILCPTCGWSATCPHCNVTLTYHKTGERLVCHYCGHQSPMVTHCPQCGTAHPVPAGFGTEKVVKELQKLFPEARIMRLDRDAATSGSAFQRVVEAFERGEADILVGTQMITKGFDFGRVSLVGILNADNLLLSPDFRASERAYQLLSQVAGRSGRRAIRGKVIIQTSDPAHPLLQRVIQHDFEGMAREQLHEREAFRYPPYARIIRFTLKYSDREWLHHAALELAQQLRKRFGRRLLGPATPAVDRIREEHLVELLLKIERGASMQRAREILREELTRFSGGVGKKINLIADVDPQ